MNEDLLYEEIYKKTQDCGRTQFVKLLQQNQIKINQLEQENKELKSNLDTITKSWKLNAKKVKELKNILTEFEKWLENEYDLINKTFEKIDFDIGFLAALEICSNKLQELKDANNEKNNK